MPGESDSDGDRVDVTFDDHPLNLNPESKWQTFFKDNEVLLQIDKDVRLVSKTMKIFFFVFNKCNIPCNDKQYFFLLPEFRRLCPDISFFQQGTDYPCTAIVNASGVKRLHRRVQHTVLRSANVERKGLGITKVSSRI